MTDCLKNKKLVKEHELFLQRFQEKYKTVEKYKIVNDKQRYSNLLAGIKTINSIFDKVSIHFADNYNVFSILRNIRTKEEITHTPFLRNLLDVNGSHKQKKLFYVAFTKELFKDTFNNKTIINYFTNIDTDYFFIAREKTTAFGKLDILIEHYSNKNPFAICIENKIYAKDQPLQLERYYNYLKNKNLKDNQIILIYLTPNGSKPHIASINSQDYKDAKNKIGNVSINSELFNNLHQKGILRLFSHKKNMTEILKNVMPNIKAENVKQTVNQYYKIIKKI